MGESIPDADSLHAAAPASLRQEGASRDIDVSIIVPLYNEQANLAPMYGKLCAFLDGFEAMCEVIFVDDGSTDGTADELSRLAAKDDRVAVVGLARNSGQTAAMSAGFKNSCGRIIVALDGDLQNDPQDIPKLVAELEKGFDVASGWRQGRQDTWGRVVVSKLANALISKVSGVHLHDYGCSLKAYRREVLDGVHLYGEMHRFIPIYATWQGAKVTEIPVTHHPRIHGKSKYGYQRILKVLLDLIVVKFMDSYLTKPMYVFGGFGIVSVMIAFVCFAAAVMFKLIPADNPWDPLWHKDFVQTPLPFIGIGLFVVGVQMVLIGLLAEIMMRTYFESQNMPSYTVRVVRRTDRSAS
jgi:glycosyltransferase involved in cell wall biosynthesis